MSKHYIRLNENNEIIKCFTDAYEKPIAGDICVNENGTTDWNLNLVEMNQYGMKYCLVYDNGIRAKTELEKQPTQSDLAYLASNQAQAKMSEIDTQSIAEIRKYIAGLSGAPATIKTLEAQYQTEAAKIK